MQVGSLQDYKLKLQIDIFRHKAQIDLEQLSKVFVHEIVFKRSALEGDPDYKTQTPILTFESLSDVVTKCG